MRDLCDSVDRTGLEIGLIAILVGIMVGKAIRHASGGFGGRPQQILAVVLTYFAITTSYIPTFVYHTIKSGKTATHAQITAQQPNNTTQASTQTSPSADHNIPAKRPSLGLGLLFLVALFAAAPFLMLTKGTGFITVFIIFIGLRQAWKLTGRSNILVVGPYRVTAGQ